MIRYMIRSKILSQSNKWHFYAILVSLIALCFSSLWYVIVLVAYFIYLKRINLLSKKIIIILITTLVLLFIPFLYNGVSVSGKMIEGRIISITNKEDYMQLTIRNGLKKILIYYKGNQSLNIGDYIKFKGDLLKVSNSQYGLYLKGNRIFQTTSTSSIDIINNSFTIENSGGYLLSFYKSKLPNEIYEYISALVFSKKVFDVELSDAINNIGISHIFSISGYHINIISVFLDKILIKFTKNKKNTDVAVSVILIIYTFICDFSYGVFRATIMYLIGKVNFYKQYNMSKLDICSIAFIIMFIINPMSFYALGFQLSFIVTFFIILGSYLLEGKNNIIKSYKLSILSFLAALPLILNTNGKINLLTIIISPIIVFIFSVVIMPLSYLMLVLYPISQHFTFVFHLFSEFIFLFEKISIFEIIIHAFHPVEVIIYYVLLLMMFVKIETNTLKLKNIISVVSFCLILIFSNEIDPFDKLIMLDVGQGDSFLIKRKLNKGNILIDSYNNVNQLKQLGIKNINTLIITHSDNDHVETAVEVIEEFNVENLIISKYDDGMVVDELSQMVHNVYRYGYNDNRTICGLEFNFIGPVRKYDSINDSSLVFTVNINNVKILFTGDIEQEAEKDLAGILEELKVDILKVPHHGSNTSLSMEFLKKVNFKTALISVGKNNYYGHPNEETILKLQNKKIYRTDQMGIVYIIIYKRKYNVFYNMKLKPNILYNTI